MIVLSNNIPNKKWKPLLDLIYYEINSSGLVRDVRNNKVLLQYNRNDGAYVKLTNKGVEKEYLLAELVLLSFTGGNHIYGNGISFKDKDIYNCNFKNLKSKRNKRNDIDNTSKDDLLANFWKCDKKAESICSRKLAISNQLVDKYDILRILKILNYKCFHCGENLNPKNWEVDHLLPVSKGGSNKIENLVCSCKTCNRIKGSLVVDELICHIKKIIKNYNNHNY